MGATLHGRGRAVLLEPKPEPRPLLLFEYVALRQERDIKLTSVLVLGGRVALGGRWRSHRVLEPDHLYLGCTGRLRPGAVLPQLVFIDAAR
ncbi:MAG: hypothetical protein R2755_28225 [Acidimicrobiales bacterium]